MLSRAQNILTHTHSLLQLNAIHVRSMETFAVWALFIDLIVF